VKIARGPSFLEPLWPVLEENLLPNMAGFQHNLEHIQRLQSLFPKEIECVVGMVKDEVVAGVVLFRTPMVIHTQYIASSTLGREVAAQTAVLKYAIDKSQEGLVTSILVSVPKASKIQMIEGSIRDCSGTRQASDRWDRIRVV
jgi:hypothetical protein